MEDVEVAGSKYFCNVCKSFTVLKLKDPIRCNNCGKNILYKVRDPNSPVQVLAR